MWLTLCILKFEVIRYSCVGVMARLRILYEMNRKEHDFFARAAFRRIIREGAMDGAAVAEKIVRYQRYLEKSINDDQVNEKHVRMFCRYYTLTP